MAGAGVGGAASASAQTGWFMMGNYNSGMCMHASSGGGAGAWVTQEVCNQNEPGQWWRITSASNRDVYQNYFGKCLDSHNGNNPGTVIVWHCHAQDSQNFYWREDAYLAVDSSAGGVFALEPPGESKRAGTQLIMWRANGTVNQKWWRFWLS
ncbi:RICIN domain-containing protein [Streptomyces sp. NPDC055254]